jgi:hypothetical protein
MNCMTRIDDLAEAALRGDALLLRSLAQDWLRENPRAQHVAPPRSSDLTVRAIAAGLVELFAQRRGELPPSWTANIGPAPRPVYLLRSAQTMSRLRRLCEMESPPPLRHRNLLAPPTFLESA